MSVLQTIRESGCDCYLKEGKPVLADARPKVIALAREYRDALIAELKAEEGERKSLVSMALGLQKRLESEVCYAGDPADLALAMTSRFLSQTRIGGYREWLQQNRAEWWRLVTEALPDLGEPVLSGQALLDCVIDTFGAAKTAARAKTPWPIQIDEKAPVPVQEGLF